MMAKDQLADRAGAPAGRRPRVTCRQSRSSAVPVCAISAAATVVVATSTSSYRDQPQWPDAHNDVHLANGSLATYVGG